MKTFDIVSLLNLLKERRIISISGESGTGKTTLALQLVASALTREGATKNQAVWVQASEQFPKKRLQAFFKNTPDTYKTLLKRIFLYPGSYSFLSYQEQSTFFTTLVSVILPFNTKYIVIDNVSHYLRFAASCCSDVKQKLALLDEFFNSQLFPLIMRCLREEIVLILIHEVSFNPALGKNQPFFNKLYSRINSVNVSLSKPFGSKSKSMELASRDELIAKEVKYKIKNKGISLI